MRNRRTWGSKPPIEPMSSLSREDVSVEPVALEIVPSERIKVGTSSSRARTDLSSRRAYHPVGSKAIPNTNKAGPIPNKRSRLSDSMRPIGTNVLRKNIALTRSGGLPAPTPSYVICSYGAVRTMMYTPPLVMIAMVMPTITMKLCSSAPNSVETRATTTISVTDTIRAAYASVHFLRFSTLRSYSLE